MSDFDDYDNDLWDLRAEVAAERRGRRPHWCSECHGHTGRGSPCYEEPETEEQEP